MERVKVVGARKGEIDGGAKGRRGSVSCTIIEGIKYSVAVPYALAAALKLRIPDILAAAGSSASLTAEQIADKLPRKAHDAAPKRGRILRLLAHKSVFWASSETEPRYGLTKYVVEVFGGGVEVRLGAVLSDSTRDERIHSTELLARGGGGQRRTRMAARLRSGQLLHHQIFNSRVRGRLQCSHVEFLKTPEPHHCPHLQWIQGHPVLGGRGRKQGRRFGSHRLRPSAHSWHPLRPPACVEHISGDFLESVPSGDAILVQVL